MTVYYIDDFIVDNSEPTQRLKNRAINNLTDSSISFNAMKLNARRRWPWLYLDHIWNEAGRCMSHIAASPLPRLAVIPLYM